MSGPLKTQLWTLFGPPGLSLDNLVFHSFRKIIEYKKTFFSLVSLQNPEEPGELTQQKVTRQHVTAFHTARLRKARWHRIRTSDILMNQKENDTAVPTLATVA